MIGKQEALIANSFKKIQAHKKIYQLSYTENRFRCYFDQFWKEQTAEFIKHVEKDHSNQIREQNCKEKLINVSSIMKNDQADLSSQISLGHILYAVGEQKKVLYEANPHKSAHETFQEKNMYTMKKKVQSQVVEVRNEKDIKLEVKVTQKKSLPKKVEEKADIVQEAKIIKKIQIKSKKVDEQPRVIIKETNEIKVKAQKVSNVVEPLKNEIQLKKQPQKQTGLKQQIKLQDITQQIKKTDLEKPTLPFQVPKNSIQPRKANESQEQEQVIDEKAQSYYHLINKDNELFQVQNHNRIDGDHSNTRNSTNNQPIADEYQEEFINQSSQSYIENHHAVNEQLAHSLNTEVKQDKKSPLMEHDPSQNQRPRTFQNPNKPNLEQMIGEVNYIRQESYQPQVQDIEDQNHFVTCITDNPLQNENPTMQFSSKMSGIQDYQSYSNVAILEQQEVSETMLLEQSVDKIVEDFMNQLETQGVILNEKVLRMKHNVRELKQANQKLSDEKEELIQQKEQINANLVQANRKSLQLLQNLEREKKQNFDNKIEMQKMRATIKELQDKDIFNSSQQINLSQGIKRNRSEQALLPKDQTSSQNNQVKKQQDNNYSDQDSEKNPSDLQDNQKKAKKDEREDQSQKNPSDQEQQSRQNTQKILQSQVQSRIYQRKQASHSSSQS